MSKKSNNVVTIAKVSGIGNCIFCSCPKDVPTFLIEDNAVRIMPDGRLAMWCVDGQEPAIRPFPVFLKWEVASAEKRETLRHLVDGAQVHPVYGTWPKDNGFQTLLHDEKGNCFPKEIQFLRAALVTEELPDLEFGQQKVFRNGNSWAIITSWGETRYGEIGKAVFVEYGPGNINIVALSEASAKEYTVFIDGVAKGNLVEFFG